MFCCLKKQIETLERKVEQNVYCTLPNAVRKNTRFFRVDRRYTGDLQHSPDDILEVEITMRNELGQCRAKNLTSSLIGYIDGAIVEQESLLNYKPWYFGNVSREMSDEILMKKDVGTFLVRKCEKKYPFALSVKSLENVKHYRIFRDDLGYCISSGINCSTLEELIFLYENDVDGLLQIERIIQPYPK
ncbi:PREDICTED: tyrosine-protein kinase STK-like [Nicrophorus vespilloides]|uniref:Tyrosine-protein kinase STK-like n=1 Tax=Nicrophorus vespilloides TaxID=110193 RepID=A0ABM1MJN8_NICVS|nr:PREDICTED: tyrosine-protein kinase STK-like [Nicrophorus vespilloides]